MTDAWTQLLFGVAPSVGAVFRFRGLWSVWVRGLGRIATGGGVASRINFHERRSLDGRAQRAVQ